MQIRQRELLKLSITGRGRELLEFCLQAFDQPDGCSARPMGIEKESCTTIVAICKELLKGEALLGDEEAKALLKAIDFARRDVCSEVHIEMHELQKSMAAIVLARNSKAIERIAEKLPKQAEAATKRIKQVLKSRGNLIDDAEKIIKTLQNYLAEKPAI